MLDFTDNAESALLDRQTVKAVTDDLTRGQLNPDTVVSVETTRQASDASQTASEVRLRVALRF